MTTSDYFEVPQETGPAQEHLCKPGVDSVSQRAGGNEQDLPSDEGADETFVGGAGI